VCRSGRAVFGFHMHFGEEGGEGTGSGGAAIMAKKMADLSCVRKGRYKNTAEPGCGDLLMPLVKALSANGAQHRGG